MLTMEDTPALEAEAPPIFANLPPPLAAQLAWQMIRLAEKTAAKEARVDIPARSYGRLLRSKHQPPSARASA
jgi:hypothetical protein